MCSVALAEKGRGVTRKGSTLSLADFKKMTDLHTQGHLMSQDPAVRVKYSSNADEQPDDIAKALQEVATTNDRSKAGE